MKISTCPAYHGVWETQGKITNLKTTLVLYLKPLVRAIGQVPRVFTVKAPLFLCILLDDKLLPFVDILVKALH